MTSDNFTINNDSGFLIGDLYKHTMIKTLVNKQINDLIVLKYDENQDIPFNLYEEYPKKLGLWARFKYRNSIKNFIIYQYSIKAKTFVERKILKNTKFFCCRNMNTFAFKNFTFFFLGILFFVGHPLLKKNLMLINLFGSVFLSNTYWWLKNNKTILLNFQINSFYKLGRESKEFVNFLENNGYDLLNEKKKKGYKTIKDQSGLYFIHNNKDEIIAKFTRDPKYYTKFFVNDIFDLKFEEDDDIFDYLDVDIYYDFHKEYLKKIQSSNDSRRNKKDMQNLAR